MDTVKSLEHKGLLEAIRFFSDPRTCVEAVAAVRWPNGPVCPKCDGKRLSFLKTRLMWKCLDCTKQFSVKVGTIFEDSPVGLDKWLTAMWMLANCKNGISSYEIGRGLGVTQKTAWFMLQRIRYAMHHGTINKMTGNVEVDETFIGGKARNMHRDKKVKMQMYSRRGDNKTVVLGILERASDGKTSRVRATVVPSRIKPIMQGTIRETVEPGATIHSDEHGGHWKMDSEYTHEMVNHLESYVQGNVHTNTLENFWSLLKRGLGGTYVSVEPFHLFRYVDEQAFRYNERRATDGARFLMVLAAIAGRRLTWNVLTAKEAG
jgi:transposase-like protein